MKYIGDGVYAERSETGDVRVFTERESGTHEISSMTCSRRSPKCMGANWFPCKRRIREMARSPTKNTQVATREESKAPVLVHDQMPDYLRDESGAVKQDQFDQSDVVVPRIKLLQGLSAECEAFDDAKAGLFWHTGFDMVLGAEFDFVVCSRRKRYLLVAPIDDGQGILARADDFVTWDVTGAWKIKVKGRKEPVEWEIADRNVKKSGLADWGSFDVDDKKSPPAATLFYDYLVLLPARLDLGPAVLSMARSQIKKCKRGLNDKIQLHQAAGRPMQGIVFQSRSVKESNTNNQSYHNWQFTGNGFADKSLYDKAMELQNSMSDYRVGDEEAAAHESDAEDAEGDGREYKGDPNI